jgi:predicted dehydrogenase
MSASSGATTADGVPPLRLAFVGCGKIAGNYAASVVQYPDHFTVVGAFDIDSARATEFCRRFGGRPFAALEDLVSSPEAEVVVNLTIHEAHAGVSRAALEAGKHVHTEKPLATTREDAAQLVALARGRGLLLACAPYIMLSDTNQTLWRAVREGGIGQPLDVVGHAMYGGIERRNPSAEAFLKAGPLFDVGVYPLSILTTVFGPVRRVRGASAELLVPRRTLAVGPRAGSTITLSSPDHVTALLEFGSSVPGRLTASFAVTAPWLPRVELYGTEGVLSVPERGGRGQEGGPRLWSIKDREWRALPSSGLSAPVSPVGGHARGLYDLYRAVRCGEPLHYAGEQGLHVVDVCLSALESARRGTPVEVATTFEAPPPLAA